MRDTISLTLPESLRTDLDSYARLRSLPRSYAAQALLEQALAAERARLDHLATHRRLTGLPEDK